MPVPQVDGREYHNSEVKSLARKSAVARNLAARAMGSKETCRRRRLWVMRAALILICLCAVRQSSRFVINKLHSVCAEERQLPGTVRLRDWERGRPSHGVNCRDRDGGLKQQLLRGNLQPCWRRRHRELSAPYSSSRQCIRQAKRGATDAMHVCSAFNRYCTDSAWNGALTAGTAGQHGYPSIACHVAWLVHGSSSLPTFASLGFSKMMDGTILSRAFNG